MDQKEQNEQNCEKVSLHDFTAWRIMTKSEIIQAKQMGIDIVMNERFTPKEDNLIKRNFRRFFCRHSIELTDEVKLMALGFFMSSQNEEYRKKRSELKGYLKEHDFRRKLGKGLDNRQLYSVYQRARKILPPLRNCCDVSREERVELIRRSFKGKQRTHKWAEIAEECNIHPLYVRDMVVHTVDEHGNAYTKGYFGLEEEIALVKGILAETQVKDISEVLNMVIPWEKVKKHVSGRNNLKCINEWMRLRNRIDTYVKPFLLDQKYYTDLDSARLIYILYKERFKYDDINDVDWDWIKSKFSNVGSLDFILRWWRFLTIDVPEKHSKTFFKSVRWMYKHKLRKVMKDTTIEELENFYNS